MKKQTLIGIGIVLLAVLIIVLAIFAPRWARKNEMRERAELLLSPDPQVVLLSDPLYEKTLALLPDIAKEIMKQ